MQEKNKKEEVRERLRQEYRERPEKDKKCVEVIVWAALILIVGVILTRMIIVFS